MQLPSDNQLHQDISEMMDRAGVNPANIQGTRAPIAMIVSRVRMSLTDEFTAYIKRLQTEPKHIEVQTEPEAPMA